MQTINNLIAYLKRHPNYIVQLIYDIFKTFWYKCTGRKILVITTGSGGIGDYLWIRSYYPIIREKGYKIVLVAMAHWSEIVESFDGNNINIIRYFESCLSPRKIEVFYFKLFRCNVYMNFCKECIVPFVKYKAQYTNSEDVDYNWFYEKRNNYIFKTFCPLPVNFSHSIPIIEPTPALKKRLNLPYVVLTEGGNTHGKLNDIQLKTIIQHLLQLKYQILFNGNTKRLNQLLTNDEIKSVIDGYQYPFPQYGYLVQNSAFIITVNTSIYHFALFLNKPCIILTPYEPRTVKVDQKNQIAVFNDLTDDKITAPQKHTDEEKQFLLNNINVNRIINAIDIIYNTKQ